MVLFFPFDIALDLLMYEGSQVIIIPPKINHEVQILQFYVIEFIIIAIFNKHKML